MTAADLKAQRAKFDVWWYSAPHRAKYERAHPAYLGGMESWQAALAAQAPVVRQEPVASPEFPGGPLGVFSEGTWHYEETGQHFAAHELDDAAFAKYRDALVAPSPQGDAEDAARYRWLRDKSEPGICAFYLSVGKALDGVKFNQELVDDAIDAARKAKP
jgi:hypothetical protein